MNRIITIGREFGSGGREFGRRLAEALGFAYYDQEIISEIAKRTSLSEQYVEAIVEHQPSFSFPIHIGRSFYPAAVSYTHLDVYKRQLPGGRAACHAVVGRDHGRPVGACAHYGN